MRLKDERRLRILDNRRNYEKYGPHECETAETIMSDEELTPAETEKWARRR